ARDRARSSPASIDPSQKHDGPLRVRFHARAGLEDLVADELGSGFGPPRTIGPGVVEAELRGPLERALALRCPTHVGLPIDVPGSGDKAEAIVGALTSPAALGILRAFTRIDEGAAIRFRLEIKPGGHQRALVWRCAELVRERTHAIVNDPRESTWSV